MTNLVPYLLAFAAANVIVHREPADPKTASRITIVATIASVYSLYALYACGESAMMWGALTTFAGICSTALPQSPLRSRAALRGEE